MLGVGQGPRTRSGHFAGIRRLLGGRMAVVLLAICSLTVSLATRTFRLTSENTVTVKAASAHAMRQHLDRDAETWLPPAPAVTLMPDVAFDPGPIPVRSLLPFTPFITSLCNRPPPSC